jgi:L-fuconolactonase
VLDHLGNPPILASSAGEWRSGVTRLAEFENVSVKISGILPHRTAGAWTIDDLRAPVEIALSVFGPERMMFGSDWPLVDLAADARSWIDVVRALIPAEHHAAVFSGTASRVYLERADA